MIQTVLLIIIGIFGGFALNRMTRPPIENKKM